MRSHRLEAAWVVFAIGNILAMGLIDGPGGTTIPFHLVWASLTLLYGFAIWPLRPTLVILAVVTAATGSMFFVGERGASTSAIEATEIPLMAAMFLAVVWHCRRRAAAENQAVTGRAREREFIRDASHNLKAPLVVTRGRLELARTARGSAASEVDRAIGEVDRMAGIVDDLLLLLTADQPAAIRHDPLDLADTVVEAVDRWLVRTDRCLLVDAEESVEIEGDRERIICLLDALIENAVAATASGDRICVSVRSTQTAAQIRVADEGHGIPIDDLALVFERFWSGPRTDGSRGTGLGLAIVRAVVDGHGGTVDVLSDDHGTTFTVTLPRAGTVDAGPRKLRVAYRFLPSAPRTAAS